MREKIKVLLFSPLPPPEGGIASWSKHILSYYNMIRDQSNIELIHLLSAKKKGRVTDKRVFSRIWMGIINTYAFLKEMRNAIKKSKPDVVHFTSTASLSLFRDFFIQSIIRKNNAANIIHFHFGRIPQLAVKKNWEWKLLKMVINRSSKSIVIDQKSYETLSSAGFDNIEFLPNPISVSILNLVEINKASNVIRERGKVLFVGHVVLTKGVYELVEACMGIPNVTLELIGPCEKSVKKDLLSIAKNRDNGEWLVLSGSQKIDFVVKKMMLASVFCLPSYTEGFPNVILESMACGCPIISTNVGAIPEMLNIDESAKKCGICVDPKDVRSLNKYINYYLNDENLAMQYGKAAQERVLSEYNISRVWDMMKTVWINSV